MTESNSSFNQFLILRTVPSKDDQVRYRKEWARQGWIIHEFLGYDKNMQKYLWKVSRGDEEHV